MKSPTLQILLQGLNISTKCTLKQREPKYVDAFLCPDLYFSSTVPAFALLFDNSLYLNKILQKRECQLKRIVVIFIEIFGKKKNQVEGEEENEQQCRTDSIIVRDDRLKDRHSVALPEATPPDLERR